MPQLDSLFRAQSEQVDRALNAFARRLAALMPGLRADIADYLGELTIRRGMILNTPANIDILNRAGEVARRAALDRGYSQVVSLYLSEYQGQVKTLERVFNELGVRFRWNADDRKLATALIGRDRNNLMAVTDQLASNVAQRARFSAGAARFSEVVEFVDAALETSRGVASSLAETGIGCFYAQLSGRKNEDAAITRFYFAGPVDKLTRPFCRKLIERGRIFDRDEIAEMENGQMPNVFVTRGGFRCRHQWLGVPEKPAREKVQ